MTYRELLDAIKYAKNIKKYQKELRSQYPKDCGSQRAISSEDIAELCRLDALLDEEIK